MTPAKSFGTTDYSSYLLTLSQITRYSNAAENNPDSTSVTNNCTFDAAQEFTARFELLSDILPATKNTFTGSFTTTLSACSIHP